MSHDLEPPYLATITEVEGEACKECQKPVIPNTVIFYFKDDSMWCRSCLESKVKAYLEVSEILGEEIPIEKKKKVLRYFT
jgi:hypothetical protein